MWLARSGSQPSARSSRRSQSAIRLLGLQRSLDLTLPPVGGPGDWPTRQDLFGILANQLEASFEGLNFALDAPTDTDHEEQQLTTLLADTLALTDGPLRDRRRREPAVSSSASWTNVSARREISAPRTAKHSTRTKLEARQDLMLAAARGPRGSRRTETLGGRLRAACCPTRDPKSSARCCRGNSTPFGVIATHSRTRWSWRARASTPPRSESSPAVCPDLSEHLLPWRVESVADRGARELPRLGPSDTVRHVLQLRGDDRHRLPDERLRENASSR